MPIFEFKCVDCDQYMEILVMNKQEEIEMVCSHCGSGNLERILSTTNHAIAGGGGRGLGEFRCDVTNTDLQFGIMYDLYDPWPLIGVCFHIDCIVQSRSLHAT